MMKTIYLAGGCFWGMQKFLDQFDGVISTETGYANGPDDAPTYEDVCSDSGHAETVKVVYDESEITLTKLLGFYFMVIDPLSVNRQGKQVPGLSDAEVGDLTFTQPQSTRYRAEWSV